MKNGFFTLLLFGVLLSASGAQAAECMLNVTRIPCPGKEEKALAAYRGQKTTQERKKVGSVAACRREAEKACAIVRKGSLKSKSIRGAFNGEAIDGGTDLCDQLRPDFNQCK